MTAERKPVFHNNSPKPISIPNKNNAVLNNNGKTPDEMSTHKALF